MGHVQNSHCGMIGQKCCPEELAFPIDASRLKQSLESSWNRTATPRGRPLLLLCLSEAVAAELLKYCTEGLVFAFDGSCLKQSLPNYWTERPRGGSGLCCSCVLSETVTVERLDGNAALRDWPSPLIIDGACPKQSLRNDWTEMLPRGTGLSH